jgi:ornithine cyclodeaminase
MDPQPNSIPWIGGEELRARLPYRKVSEALKRAFDPSVTAPPRHLHSVGTAGAAPEAEKILALMPSWSEAHGLVGVKLFTYFAGNRQIGLPVIHSIYIAVDANTGVVRAVIDGGMLTNIRTAALSALAATYLARPDSRTLLVVGTGELAPHLALAHAAVQPFDRILVWGRRHDAARESARSLREQGLPAEPTESIEVGLSSADVVVAATSSTSPLIKRQHVRAGTHVSLLGGFRPQMREADDELVASSRIVLETIDGVSSTAGDIVGPLKSGAIQRSQLTTELRDLVSGRQPPRQTAEEITLFKSVGDAREDLCAASLAL